MQGEDGKERRTDPNLEWSELWRDFVRLFNPKTVRIIGILSPSSFTTPQEIIPSIDLKSAVWNDLENLTFERSCPSSALVETCIAGPGADLARRRGGTDPRPLKVTFEGAKSTSFAALNELAMGPIFPGDPSLSRRACLLESGWITLVVRSALWRRDQVDRLVCLMERGWTQEGVSRDEQKSWKARLIFDALA